MVCEMCWVVELVLLICVMCVFDGLCSSWMRILLMISGVIRLRLFGCVISCISCVMVLMIFGVVLCVLSVW